MLPIVARRSSVAASTIRLIPSSSSSSSILSSMMKNPRLAASMSTSTRLMKNQSMPKMMRWNAITATLLQRTSSSSSSKYAHSSIASFHSMAPATTATTSVTSIRSSTPMINRVGNVASISSQTLLASSSSVTPPSSSDSSTATPTPSSSSSSLSPDPSLSVGEAAAVGIVGSILAVGLAWNFVEESIFVAALFFIRPIFVYFILPACFLFPFVYTWMELMKTPEEKEEEARAFIKAAEERRAIKAKKTAAVKTN